MKKNVGYVRKKTNKEIEIFHYISKMASCMVLTFFFFFFFEKFRQFSVRNIYKTKINSRHKSFLYKFLSCFLFYTGELKLVANSRQKTKVDVEIKKKWWSHEKKNKNKETEIFHYISKMASCMVQTFFFFFFEKFRQFPLETYIKQKSTSKKVPRENWRKKTLV